MAIRAPDGANFRCNLRWSIGRTISIVIFIVRFNTKIIIKMAIITFVIVFYALAISPTEKSRYFLFFVIIIIIKLKFYIVWLSESEEQTTNLILYSMGFQYIWDLQLVAHLEAKSHWLHLFEFLHCVSWYVI